MNVTEAMIIWLWWIGGGIVALAGLILAYWSLLHNRSRGIRRCPKCWYDMSHTEGNTCSECGRRQKHNKRFSKTRRRWRWAVVALLMMITGSIGTQWPRIHKDGWFAIVPNYALIFALPVAGDFDGVWWSEVKKRFYAEEYSENEFYYLIEKCANGDIFTRPTSMRWQMTYGHFIEGVNTIVMQRLQSYPEDIYDLQNQILAHVDIEIHNPWPRDIQPRFQIYSDDWWPQNAGFKVTVTPRVEGIKPITSWNGTTVEAVVPLPDTDKTTIVFDVLIERLHHSWRDNPKETPIWEEIERRVIKKDVVLAESIDKVITPVNSTEIDTAVKRILLNPTFRDGKFVNGYMNHIPTFIEACEDTAFGITVELLHNDRVIAHKDFWWRSGSPFSDDIMHISPWVTLSEETFDSAEINSMTARIRSNKELAIRVPGVNKYWEGEVDIPLGMIEQ